MDKEVLENANYWANSAEFDPNTQAEITNLLKNKNNHELSERFYKNLSFGTGGLRGILGAGTSRMNIYNIRKASTALALQLKEKCGTKQIKVAISYDTRKFSLEFGRATAEIFAAHKIQCYLTSKPRPVPMLSFLIRHFKCDAGVCITASHNPRNYNGYKAYWNTGGQLVAPNDIEIIAKYNNIKTYKELVFSPEGSQEYNKYVHDDITAELDKAFYEEVKSWQLINDNTPKDLKIVYSPLHGCGLEPVQTVLEKFGFSNVSLVKEQCGNPNGEFKTLQYPNPEDPEAMSMALDLAQKIDADLILATDPDCDRIGFIIKDKEEYFTPNGHQIACLLNEFVLNRLQDKGQLKDDSLIVKTIVTSNLQKDIANYYGVSCDETLTGFKWIGELIDNYESGKLQPYKNFICGGEESFGFMAGKFIRDKDGVTASFLVAQMVAFYKSQNLTLVDVLNQIYLRHGYYYEILESKTMPGKEGGEKIQKIMKNIRENSPKSINNEKIAIIKDFQKGLQYALTNDAKNKQTKLALPKSNVLQFITTENTTVSVRPSGTEPKIKLYISVLDKSFSQDSDSNFDSIKLKTKKRAQNILTQVLQWFN